MARARPRQSHEAGARSVFLISHMGTGAKDWSHSPLLSWPQTAPEEPGNTTVLIWDAGAYRQVLAYCATMLAPGFCFLFQLPAHLCPRKQRMMAHMFESLPLT